MKTIATLIVGFVLGSTSLAFAGRTLLTGKDIRDGSIEMRDLSHAARAALRGQRGPVGPPGPAGSAGSAFELEARVGKLETRVSFFCPTYGRLVEYVEWSRFSNSLEVRYHNCRGF